ncbi:Ig-like domain-containing protein [Dryocola sp. BD613]|uniref:Ig-like domain-containing protein n=1 Tax=Dryocola sp. BD613 TaxID=3133272 RepID=UPI003F5017CB
MSKVKIVDVIIRKTAEKTVLTGEGNLSVSVSAPVVIEIHGSARDVARYMRQGKDLLIYMKDGSVIRCNNYFIEDPDSQNQCELVFNDGQGLTHISFADTGKAAELAATELTAQATPVTSIEPFLEQGSVLSDAPWGWIAGAVAGGGGIGALLANGGNGETKTKVINEIKEVESATPTFMVLDKAGDKQGVLSAKETTDDNTPTFNGTGQPGATIQIKDHSGNTIASAMVGKEGTWTVKLPAQTDGEHTWSVVQINGSKATSVGSITMTVATAETAVTLATTAGDNVINASEQSAGFTLSGASKNLAQGTELTVTLNGKTYTAEVGVNGSWSVNVPAGDAKALGEGIHMVSVRGKDAAGNTVTGNQTLNVDTHAPTLSVDAVAQDNIINAAEHGQALTLRGTTSVEAGQIVTITSNGKNYTAPVGSDGTWSLTLNAGDVQALADGDYTLTVNVSDKAGNSISTTADFSVDTAAPVVSINTIAGNDVLNASEQGRAQIISGHAHGAAPGDVVIVTIGGQTYTGAVQADGSWSVGVPALAIGEGNHRLSVSVTDAAGNSGFAETNLLVDTALPQVIINNFAGDNLVNSAEAAADQTLSGRVAGAAAGDTVSINVGGKSYTTMVGSDLTWSVVISSETLTAFGDGSLTFTASVTNAHGNTGTGERDININASLPGLRINAISGDDVINIIEQQQDLTITGSSSHLEQGARIIVTISGVDYPAAVAANGNWQIGVPAADLQNWMAGEIVVAASAQDAWGNTVSAGHPIELDLNAVAVTIDMVTSDDIINAAEKGRELTLSGRTQGVEAGQTLAVKFADQTFTAQVQQDGSWQLAVPVSALGGLSDGRAQISVSAINIHGNSADAARVVTTDTLAPTIAIDNLTSDSIINAADTQQDLLLIGSTDAEAGQIVTVALGGKQYQATVQNDGSWQLRVPAAGMGALVDGDITMTASVSDVAGNSTSVDLMKLVDISVPQVTIHNFVTDANTVNQAAHAQAQILSGSVSGAAAGDLVTVTINNVEHTTVVDTTGNWSLGLSASFMQGLTDGTWTIDVSITDRAGNTGSSSLDVMVNTSVPEIAINPLTGDDVINAAEKSQALLLSGTSDRPQGTAVTVTLNGIHYTALTDASGNWSVSVPASAVGALGEANYTLTASVTNSVGNAAFATHDVQVDSSLLGVIINTLAGDNIVNAAEVAAGQTLTGKVVNAAAGDTVIVTLGGQTFSASVQEDLTWSLPLSTGMLTALGNGELTATAMVTNAHGNTGSFSQGFTIDARLPGLRIDTVAGDDVINLVEHGHALIVSGTVTGAQAGDLVTVTLNGKDYTAVLDEAGSWSVGVSAGDVGALTNGNHDISVSVTDKAGNSNNVTHHVDVALTAPVIAINTVAGDDVINATEKGQHLLLSGTSNQPQGTAIAVMLNGIHYAAIADTSGNWNVTVPASAVRALGEANYAVTASVIDNAGNRASAEHDILVDYALPVVIVNAIATDDIINAAEVAAGQTISGKVSNAASGDTVSVVIGGNTYTTSVQNDLSWSVHVPADVLTAIGNGDLTVKAAVTNERGNTGSGHREISIDANLPGLRVDTVAGDDVINSIEHGQHLIISGTSADLAAGTALTVTVNSKTYPAIVLADGAWAAAIPAADVGAFAAGNVTITVAGQSGAGNPVSISHNVTVDLATVAISIDAIAMDDVINAAEKGADLVLSGTTSNVEENQAVYIIFGGKSYTANVDASGNWMATVPSAGLKDGDASVQVSVVNVNGNGASAGREYRVDTTAPSLSVGIVSDNNIINAAEARQDLIVNGTSDVEAGQTVRVTLNGVEYATTVQANGKWSVSVPSVDLIATGDGNYTVSASVANKAGNPASANRDVLVDTTVPQLVINTVFGDDVINSSEHGQALIVSGSAVGAAAGDVVTVTINNKSYTATLNAAGGWSVGVPAAEVEALTAGKYTITAAVTDKAGNSNSATHDVEVNLTAPVLTIDTVSDDDAINNAEKAQDLVISGTATGLATGAVVTVTLNGKACSATVDANGKWTTTVPAEQVGALGEALYNISASATNSVGNSTSTTHAVTVESVLPGVIINAIAGDDVVNAAEVAAGQTISGKVVNAEAGDTVTVTLGGNTYTATVQSNLGWSVNVPEEILTALGNGELTVVASVTNGVGNSGTGERDIIIDASLPGLRVSTVAGDDAINLIEHGQNLIITGSSYGLTAGTTLTVTVNSKTYPATVLADGAWSATVPAADMGALAEGRATITVEGQSTAGNPVSISHGVTVDLAPVAISVDAIATDDVINTVENNADLVLSGTTSNVEENQTVTITFGGKSYTATVEASGNWTAIVPSVDLASLQDGAASVQVSVTNVNGNSASAGREYHVDATAPSVTIGAIASDNILNAMEAQADLTINGTSTAEAGQTVTVTLNGKTYITTMGSDGTWALNVPAADLAALANGSVTVTASVNDKAGNPASVERNLTVGVTVPSVTINPVAEDDVINMTEHGQAQVFSGSATGAAAGDKVTVTLGGHTYTTVLDAAGNWNIEVPANVISGLSDGTVTVNISVTDAAGNAGSGTHNVTVDTGLPSPGFDIIAGDNVLNALEKQQPLTIQGFSGVEAGQTVTVSLNGKSYTAEVLNNGVWTLNIPAADLAVLSEGALAVTASVNDKAGNSGQITQMLTVDTVAPTVTIDTVAGNNIVNNSEQQAGQTLSGTTTAEQGQMVTLTFNGHSYQTAVLAGGKWSLFVAGHNFLGLGDGDYPITASVSDKAGNPGSATHVVTLNGKVPVISINAFAGDDIVSAAEHGTPLVVSGTTDAPAGQTVTITLNGKTYTATVRTDKSWSCTVGSADVSALADGGACVINAQVSNIIGNSASSDRYVTVDLSAPSMGINIDSLQNDSGLSASDFITNDSRVVVKGTLTAQPGNNEKAQISLDGGATWTDLTVTGASWRYSDGRTLSDGTYQYQVRVIDNAGNVGATDSKEVVVDRTAPAVSAITVDSVTQDTGLSDSDFITSDSQIDLQGTLGTALGSGDHAQISIDGGATWTDLTVTGTRWRYSDSRTLSDGTYQYQVRVIDNAGNVSATASQAVVVDRTAPAASAITVDSVTQDTGLSGGDFITSDNQISLKGALDKALGSGERAQISIDGGAIWIDVNVSGLTWTYVDSRKLADGDYNYQLRVIDDAGNVSATASQVVTIDTVAPASGKTITIDSISEDSGLSNSDFITNDASLTLRGSLGAALADDEFVQITLDGGITWQNATVIGNAWYHVDGRTLENQTCDYWVRVIDMAGNVGAWAHQQVRVDTVAPDEAVAVTVDNITVDTGFNNNDFLTSKTSCTLHGTLGKAPGADEFVQLSLDGGASWVYATVSGTTWSYADTRTLTDGDHSYQVRVVDQAGNVGSTTSQVVTVDTQAPRYGITVDAIAEDTGRSGSDFITSDKSLTISGTLGSALASDERAQISPDGGATWTDVTTDGTGWRYTDTRELTDGDYTWQLRIIDEAGNVGSTAQQVVTVDTRPPTTLGTVVGYTDSDGERRGDFGLSVVTDDTTPMINGTLNQAIADDEIAELYRDGLLLGQVMMNGSAGWSFQDSGLGNGDHTYVLRVTDKAGNYAESAGFVLSVDTSVPTTTAAVTAQTTPDTTPIVGGTVSAGLMNGEYLAVTVNDKIYTSQAGGAVVVDPHNNTWYLQIPDGDALSASSYDVTAQVKSSAGNGNATGIATGGLTVETVLNNTDWASASGNGYNSTMTLGLNSSGLWNIIANGHSYSSSDTSSYTGSALTNTRSYYLINQTAADFDRNGTADVFATESDWGGSTQVMWTYNGTSYAASQPAMGTTIYYGGVIAYDKTGDGYLDLAYGDAGMDSLTYLVNNNGVLTPDGTGGEGGFYARFNSGREISGVDLNNDGSVDIVQHTDRSGAYSLTVINNKGDGTLSIGQNITGVFVGNAANSTTAASMTWADYNGDGYMDLYLGTALNNTGGVIYYNNGTGQLSTVRSAVEAPDAAAGYLSAAVDWNGDGQMDIVKLSAYGSSQTATLFTNNSFGSTWTSSQLAAGLAKVTGVAAVDYNWDGAQDLLVSQQNGKVALVQNSQTIADGTAMHLHIVDSEGINAYYGNTINLYNAAGVPIASQIVNAQSGIGFNDTSALVSFYGLEPNETYSVEIVKMTNGKLDNVIWDGLVGGNGKEGYVLTAEAATGGHSGTLTGTGYNDTFIAEAGTYTYNGSGGWNTSSGYDTWNNIGGTDVVDYRNATSGISVDLRLSTAQVTGFGTSRLNNIEGIAGSNYDDVIIGNSGDNQFEGRGGNDTFALGSGGHDTLLYKLIDASDATGGNGSDVVNGFTVGTWEGTADTDRIDLRDLLSGSGYTGTGAASYVNDVATLDSSASNISDYIRVVQNGSNTEIQMNRDGTGSQFDPTTVVTLNGVQTDLATLLANHQLLIA